MAEKLTIARPYAKAVFEQALADDGLKEWDQMLQTLAAIAGDSNAASLLDSPLMSDQQLSALFVQVTEKMLPQLSSARRQELKNFLATLIAEKRLAVLPEILHRYQALVTAAQALKEVTVFSAYPLGDERRNSMTAALSQYLHSKVAVDFKEDTSLIGGVLIRSGNWVMDGSIKGKLQRLRDNLQE